MSKPRFNRIHAICQMMRDGTDKKCQRCPIRYREPGIGWCVRGCVWKVQEIINVAKIGWPWKRGPNGKRGRTWRQRVFKDARVERTQSSQRRTTEPI